MTPQEIADAVKPLIEQIDHFIEQVDIDELKAYQAKMADTASTLESAMILTDATVEDVEYRRSTDRFFKSVIALCEARDKQKLAAFAKAYAKGKRSEINRIFGV